MLCAQSPAGVTSFPASNWNQSDPIFAVLDSGSTVTLLPPDTVNAIYAYLGVTYDQTPGGNMLPCDRVTAEALFTFSFGGSGGPRINVPISDFIMPRDPGTEPLKSEDGTPGCMLSVIVAQDYRSILSDSFTFSGQHTLSMTSTRSRLP